MSYYLSEETIKDAFFKLKNLNYDSNSELFHFLLLKSAGFNSLSPINLDSESTKEIIFNSSKKLGALFVNENKINGKKEKFNFINPLAINDWGKLSEPLIKWSKLRFKNNIVGGGEQWKLLISSDEDNINEITEKNQGIYKLIKTDLKVPSEALAIWFFRFTNFKTEKTKSELIESFYRYFNLEKREINKIFTNNNVITINYSISMINPFIIRKWLKSPSKIPSWVSDSIDVDNDINKGDSIVMSDFSGVDFSSYNSESFYTDLLNKAYQLIFMGAPGTSKSYITNKIKKNFNESRRVQFHPQYTYQDFIKGQVLKDGNVYDKKGDFIEFLDVVLKNPNKEYLFIIEEINRANVSQVFGELIQLLDRGETLEIDFNGTKKTYSLPKNLKIIGTMNTTDRTVGRIDYAIKRRFYQIHFYPNYNLLSDKVMVEDNIISLSELMSKINDNLINNLNDKEMVIGHAMFFNRNNLQTNGMYLWSKTEFCNLFNYLIEPIIEDYCDNDNELIISIIGKKLIQQKNGKEFYTAIKEFLI